MVLEISFSQMTRMLIIFSIKKPCSLIKRRFKYETCQTKIKLMLECRNFLFNIFPCFTSCFYFTTMISKLLLVYTHNDIGPLLKNRINQEDKIVLTCRQWHIIPTKQTSSCTGIHQTSLHKLQEIKSLTCTFPVE